MKKIFPSIAVMLLLFLTANAQPYYFRHYQVENGLSNNTVFCSAQDKKGFLWFGTKDGLNRFDGYQFKTFPIIKNSGGSLTRDLVLSLATDQRGTLWVGTQNGLFYFDAKREKFIPFLDTLHGINNIFFDHKGQLWFIADFTVYRYAFGTKQTTTFPPEWFFHATSLCETDDGTMWFSTDDGFLQRFDAATLSFKAFDVFAHSPLAESKVIQKIAFDKKGAILIGTNNQGIKEFGLDRLDYKDVLTFNPNKTTIYVRDILQVSDEETWFATESGIFIRNNASGKWLNLKKKSLTLILYLTMPSIHFTKTRKEAFGQEPSLVESTIFQSRIAAFKSIFRIIPKIPSAATLYGKSVKIIQGTSGSERKTPA